VLTFVLAAPLLQEYTVRERAHTEAAIAYAYDAERGVQMRSCGTQAHGNTAAVQADITAFGMTGEHCMQCVAKRSAVSLYCLCLLLVASDMHYCCC
jgi:hypothetical protein